MWRIANDNSWRTWRYGKIRLGKDKARVYDDRRQMHIKTIRT